MRAAALQLLARRELGAASEQIGRELNKIFVRVQDGDRIDGKLVRRVDLESGRFALVEKSREFSLVPWRPVLEQQVGREVLGIVRSHDVNWRFGRDRGGPTI